MTMRFKVLTPVRGFTGEAAGVHFVNGEAVVDGDTHASAMRFFRRRHYGISRYEPAAEHGPEPVRSGIAEVQQGERGPEADDGQSGGDTKPPDGSQGGGEPKQPAKNASQEDWAAYASQVLDITPEEASTKTRTELVALVDEHEKENDQ